MCWYRNGDASIDQEREEELASKHDYSEISVVQRDVPVIEEHQSLPVFIDLSFSLAASRSTTC